MNYSVDIIDGLDNTVKETRNFETLAEADNDYYYFKDVLLEGGDTIQLWDKSKGYELLKSFECIDVDYQIALIEANFKECENCELYDISFQKAVRNGKEIELIYATPIGDSVELTQVGDDSQNFPLTELDDVSLKNLAERTIGVENQKLDYGN